MLFERDASNKENFFLFLKRKLMFCRVIESVIF